jgi:hypothetical protein
MLFLLERSLVAVIDFARRYLRVVSGSVMLSDEYRWKLSAVSVSIAEGQSRTTLSPHWHR